MPTLDDALAALGDSTDAIADTQSTPSYAMPKVQQKAAPTMDDALATLEPDQNEPLRDAVNLGTQKNSANSTKVLQLFGKTGLPRDFIERNQDFVQQESDKQDFNPDKLMKDSPAFASWLSEHPDHVAAAKPDVQALSLIEKQLRNIPAQFEKGQQTVEYGDVMLGVVKGLLDKTDVTALRKRQSELEASMSKPDPTGLADETGIAGIAQRAPGWMAQQLPVLSRTLQEQVKTGATGLAVGALGGGAIGGLPGAAAGGAAVGLASWRVGAAISSAKMEFGQAFGEYEKLKDENGQPLDQQTAMGLAGMVGVVNGSIDGFFGIEGLTSKLPGINQFTRDGIKELLKTPTTRAAVLGYAKTVGQVMATEGATEALQMYITKTGGVALQAVKDGGAPSDWLGKIFTQENLKQAATEAEAGAFGGGGIASVMATPGLAGDIAKVREANKAKQAFEAIGKATEGAKFAQDLPDSLKEIISRATKDGPIEQVYVPSESFNTYFQKEGVDPREVYKEITGNVDAYDQAAETGADLPIQTADYVKNLAGTKHNEFFAKELRADIDSMNAREAEQWVKDQDAQAEAEAAAIAQPGIQSINTNDPAAEVRKDIAGQLQAAGFDPTVVDQYAGLFESRYRARAERRGLGETAADLFKQNNLTITRPVPEVLKTLGGNTSELDALLNRLRVGDLPKPQEVFGQSLHEFLKEKGGIQDQGGELASRNVDHGRQPFKKNLVQKQGMTLDEAAQRAAEAGYIDDRDINKLIEAIDQEGRGNAVYALGKENTGALDTQNNLESLKAYLDSKGIDLANTPNADIKKLFGEAVQQTLPGAAGQTFVQSFNDGDKPKGSITFGDGEINIKLLEKADFSTLIHEVGHLYLNELIADATTPGVSTQLTSDLDTILAWLKLDVRVADGADAIKAAIKTKHHEQFARGFEAYTMEGKSPSQAMREAFATFRQWLIQAYRSLTTAPLNVKLTKDVREVLDRMIATDQEIDAAAQEAEVHPLFTTAVSAGMSTIEFAAYQETVKEASMIARETLQKQLMAQYQRKHEKWWKTELEATRAKILEQVNEHPEYVALSVLQTGTMPDGSALPDGIEPMKLDRKAIADQFGADFLTTMPNGTMRKGGMHPDTAAPLFGFNSGQEMVMAMVNARPKNELVNAQADQEMQDRYGDMRFDGSIAEAARAAVMNEHQEKVIAAEIRALNAKAREVQPFVKAAEDQAKAEQKQGRENMKTLIPPMNDVRKLAKEIIAKTIIKKLRPYDYFLTAQRASKEATAAADKHEYLRAGLMKQRELMNLALYREALKAKDQIESIVEHMRTLESKAAQERLGKAGADYQDRINDLLERYEFSTVSLKKLDQRQSLREWIQEKQDNGDTLGEEYNIPQSVLDDARRNNYKNIPFEELLGIRDTVRQIEHFASLKNTLLKAQGIREKDVLRASLIESINAAFKDRGAPPLTANGETSMQKATHLAQQLDASLLKTELFVEWLDGGKAGPWHDALWNPAAEAQNEENDLTKTVTEKVAALVLKMPQAIRSKMMDKVTFNGVDNTMVRKDLLGVGMNIGNQSNYDKLLQGMNWTEGQVQDMADALTAEEIGFLNGMFDTLESLWPQIAALQKRLTGIEPLKIEAKPFTAKNGVIKGGYYPVMYDPIQSKQGTLQLGDQIGSLSNTMRATIPSGYRKARVEGFSRPFNLNIDALPAHTSGVIHDLTHREWFMDARWITDDTRIRAALQRHVGAASVTRLSDWVNQVANDRNFRSMASMAIWEQSIEHLRYNAMIVGMGFRASTMISQLSGVAPAIAQIGGKELDGLKWFSKGVVTTLSHPRSSYDLMTHKSGEMRHRINTRDRDIRSQLLLLQGKTDILSDVRRVGLELIGLTELMVSMPSWMGGYYKALAANKTDKQAVYEADSVVRLGQGAGGAKDLSAVMARSDTLMRVLTMYHTPFSALYAQLRSIGHDFGGLNPKSVYQLSVRLFYTVALAATLGAAASGKGPDDKKDEDWTQWLIKNVALYPFLSVPVLRDVMSAIINDYGYSFTPLQRAIESQATLAKTGIDVVAGDKELTDLAEKAVPAFSYLLGLPTSQLEITGTYLYDLANDKAHPDDLFQFVHDMIYKRPKE